MNRARLSLGQNNRPENQKSLRLLKDTCGKVALLDKMLPVLKRDGHKCLIFSQMTRMLSVLEDYLEESGHSYCRIDGSTPRNEREELIARFNSDPSLFCFLLSTRAGGLGINLTGADTVIIFDSDWNPQVDLQAQDRCHRIGQTRPVCVYRLITASTVESSMLRRANRKLKLERLVIHEGGFRGNRSQRQLSEKEVREILNDEAPSETPISDSELARLLDRETCMRLFDSAVHADGEGGNANVQATSILGCDFVEQPEAKF